MLQSATYPWVNQTVFMAAGMAAMWYLDSIVTVVEAVGGSCINLSWGIWQPPPKDLRAPIPSVGTTMYYTLVHPCPVVLAQLSSVTLPATSVDFTSNTTVCRHSRKL